jgi:hypothetical protein
MNVTAGPTTGSKEEQTVDPYVDFESDIRDFQAAIDRDLASFDQLTTARGYVNDPDLPEPQKQKAQTYYPQVLQAFENANGRLVNIYCSDELGCYVGLTAPMLASRFSRIGRRLNVFGTYPPKDPVFHFFYDLTKAGVHGAPLLARVEQLAKETPRLLKGPDLADCVARLYSTATDLAAVLEDDEKSGQSGGHEPVAAVTDSQQPKTTANGLHAKSDPRPSHPSTLTDMLDVISDELDTLELRYLKTQARAVYFLGAMVGIGVATVVTLVGVAYGLDNLLLQMWLAGAVGGMLSIMQRLNDDNLDVKYQVGPAAAALSGTLRPILGGFAGFLTLLLVLSRIVPLPVSTGSDGYYLVILAFAAGFAERSIPDIISKAQNAETKVDPKSAS